ncbi:deoxyribodipyrimidine photo-lyase [Humibacter sp. RRB41]|uniref:cryptochrome/photolyase family protein n=1 Tax=Humibacter sp. RRB41 TaxID=2919946 RepID=UPI001FAA54A9|nr:deoxyribodipyrimidine photo-lyase [Humibacter sp. RRB41]
MTSLVWIRDDLRLADHPALYQAAADPEGLICLYVLDEETPSLRRSGGAARWWLHHSLAALRQSLARYGVPLTLRRGRAESVLGDVVTEAGVDRVFWNRRYGEAERTIDASLKRSLKADGVQVDSFGASLLREPWTVSTKTGSPYRVYSAYWRACRELPTPRLPFPVPSTLAAAPRQPRSDDLGSWTLLPRRPDWSGGFQWAPGEAGAIAALARFLDGGVGAYAKGRDFFAADATSNLSPHLRWGELSPFTVWHSTAEAGQTANKFLAELGWREFAWYTLYHHTGLVRTNIDSRFDAFPWDEPDPDILNAWRTGTTGFPIVDAGMRELWTTGSMHNRARMVTASFLTKNLLYDWRIGEKWFWDTLVDADQASSPFNWQWVAGSGMDAAPYFRIFNPLTQQRKFDPDGRYVQRWAPDSGSRDQIIELDASRRKALKAFHSL